MIELDWEAVSYPIFESCQGNSEGLNWISMGYVFKMRPGGGREGGGPERTNRWQETVAEGRGTEKLSL